MKKAFKQYFFPLCLLLLGGLINLYAYSQSGSDDENACYIEGYDNLETSTFHELKFGVDKKHYAETEVEEQEEREEEVAFNDFYLQNGGYLTAFFYASLSGQLFDEPNIDLVKSTPDSISAPLKRHIRFQVFRI